MLASVVAQGTDIFLHWLRDGAIFPASLRLLRESLPLIAKYFTIVRPGLVN